MTIFNFISTAPPLPLCKAAGGVAVEKRGIYLGGVSVLLLLFKTMLPRSEASENLNDEENCPSGQPRTLCPKGEFVGFEVVISTVN